MLCDMSAVLLDVQHPHTSPQVHGDGEAAGVSCERGGDGVKRSGQVGSLTAGSAVQSWTLSPARLGTQSSSGAVGLKLYRLYTHPLFCLPLPPANWI